MLDEYHDGHGKDSVDLARNVRELATGVVSVFQFDREENVGLKQSCVDASLFEQTRVTRKLLIGKLEQEIGGLPVGSKRFRFVEVAAAGVGADEIEKGLRL